jgi:hypothetical protein
MMTNIHVSLAWMPVKALLANGRAISAGTLRILDIMEETRLMLQRRVSPERVRRLTLFGCCRHPDAKPITKFQAYRFKVSVRLITLHEEQHFPTATGEPREESEFDPHWV